MERQYRAWVMKSEPGSYAIGDLQRDRKTAWTGVRNFQARNFMRAMRKGDTVLFYHSNCPVPGVYGIARVASDAYPDPTQFDAGDSHFDPRATREKPVWDLVDIAFVRKLREPVALQALRAEPRLRGMMLLRPGSRLSVTPVTDAELEAVLALA